MTPSSIRQTRIDSGLTQKKCAECVGVALRTWQAWEQGINKMPSGMMELFKLKTEVKNG